MRIEQTGYRGIDFQPSPEQAPAHTGNISKAKDLVDLTSPTQIKQSDGDVRADRVAEVRQRIASGFYNQSFLREQIASAFLNAQGIGHF